MDSASDKPSVEITFDELAEIVREKDQLKVAFPDYLRMLENAAEAAQRKLMIAKCAADTCAATKLRKPRRDRGTKRKKPDGPAQAAEAAPGTEL